MMTAKAVLFCSTSLLCFSPEAIGQSSIFIYPNIGDISGSAYGEVFTVARFRAGVHGDQNAVVKFRVERVDMVANAPMFLVVSPSEGSTEIRIGPNPNVIRNMLPTRPPGTYGGSVTFTTVDQSPPTTFRALVRLTLRGPPSPSVGSVANTASFKPAITPGAMVSIIGENLGPPVFAAEYNGDGRYPTTFGNTTVTFNGIAAPLLYVSPGQINAVAPSALAGQKSAQVVVSRYGQSSAPFSVPVSETSPSIFTYTPNGSTQGAPLNFNSAFPSYSSNSPDNPAAPGSVVVLFATGTGPWEDPEDAGGISLVARPFVAKPVSLTIGGQPSRILYAGASPYQTLGMLQVNAFVPEGIGPGPQSVVLSIGGVDNAEQRAVIAIK